jgi:hypothetical protein
MPATDDLTVVLVGLVSATVNHLHGGGEEVVNASTATSDEMAKKQKRNNSQSMAGSLAAAECSPRRPNELHKCELLRVSALLGSSRVVSLN